MALSDQIAALATAVGTDVKDILKNVGNLDELTTTDKASLVVALNELKAKVDESIAGSGVIDDASTGLTKTWSSQKISESISKAISDLIGGAPEALDTLKEVATAIQTNQDAIKALQTIAAGHVKFDTVQSLSEPQKKQARDNIDAASKAELATTEQNAQQGISNAASALSKANEVDGKVGVLAGLTTATKTNIVVAINEVKTSADSANNKAIQVESSLNEFKRAVGDTESDFAKTYTTARNGTSS